MIDGQIIVEKGHRIKKILEIKIMIADIENLI